MFSIFFFFIFDTPHAASPRGHLPANEQGIRRNELGPTECYAPQKKDFSFFKVRKENAKRQSLKAVKKSKKNRKIENMFFCISVFLFCFFLKIV